MSEARSFSKAALLDVATALLQHQRYNHQLAGRNRQNVYDFTLAVQHLMHGTVEAIILENTAYRRVRRKGKEAVVETFVDNDTGCFQIPRKPGAP